MYKEYETQRAFCVVYITDDDEHFEPLNNFSDNILVWQAHAYYIKNYYL